jgi:superfamily II DNA/RNA helicase
MHFLMSWHRPVSRTRTAQPPRNTYYNSQPSLPERTSPVVYVRLNQTFSPILSEQEQKKFLGENMIKLTGPQMSPPAKTFEELKLPLDLLQKLKAKEWASPTPIQSVSIPVALSGNDLVGISKTGSGKTGCFIIPAIVHIGLQEPMKSKDGPICLVLSPTRELAQQINQVTEEFGISTVCLFGGAPRPGQIEQLRRGPSIVIATPGRLNDFLSEQIVSLERVNFLVLDEADRMLDMGFEPQIRAIIEKIPAASNRQTMMFSATWTKEVNSLANDFIQNPVHMIVGSSELTINTNITQIIEKVDEYEKLSKSLIILDEHKTKKVLVFVKTKKNCDDLASRLYTKGFKVDAIHGDKAQFKRDKILSLFRSTKIGILVATDVAARGLDVDDIDLVLNFDFPGDIESYVHRIGRTARGSKIGKSISFFTPEDKNLSRKLTKILRQGNQLIPEWLVLMAESTPRGAHRNGYSHRYGKRNEGADGFVYGRRNEFRRDSYSRGNEYSSYGGDRTSSQSSMWHL